MSNPFLYDSFGGSPPQQNYPNNQQNQGWNQNNTQSNQSTFQSPQMNFFDMTTPQFNQAPTNSKPLGANDFRSLMNSPSNDSTSQFSQQIQPPRDLNQLRSMFTRENEPIIAPITPQTNPPPTPYSTSTYSPSFTFVPETVSQNQATFQQGQIPQTGNQPQATQATVDFSKYDPLAGEIINSNIAKQKASNEKTQDVGKLPDGETVPIVFYGADSTSINDPSNQIQFGGNFPPFQANQNQAQPQNNFFNGQQSNQAVNAFNPQIQQQQNANIFNIPASQQTQNQSQSPDIFKIQNIQQPPQPAANVFNNQTMQQTPQPVQPVQQQQQNTDFFNIQSTQQSQPATPSIFGDQSKQNENSNVFSIPSSQQANDNVNPFLPPQKPQSSSTDVTIPVQISENSPINATNEGQAQSNPSLSVFDMFRASDTNQTQQQQQNSSPVTIPPSPLNQPNSPLDDIFGDVIQPKPVQQQDQQQQQQDRQQQQQQTDIFDPFGRNKNSAQQSEPKPSVSSENPFTIPDIFQVEVNAPKSEPTFATVDDNYNPFGDSANDKENPFSTSSPTEKNPPPPPATSNSPIPSPLSNSIDLPSKPPEKPPNEPSENPFVGITSSTTNPFISGSKSDQEKQTSPSIQSQQQAQTASPDEQQEPFDPFGRNSNNNNTANSIPSTSNNQQEPFHPFASMKSGTETKKESSMSNIRSLFASSSNDLFSKPDEQTVTTTANDEKLPTQQEQNKTESLLVSQETSTNQESNKIQQQNDQQNNLQQNEAPAFDPFGVGSSLPVMEGASFTFNIDEHEENEKSNNSQIKQETESSQKSDTTTTETSQSTTTNNDSPFFSPFEISQPPSQPQTQQQQQKPQIVDDLFFDFSSVPPKSDNNEIKTIDNQNKPTESPEANINESVRVATDESSMSLSGDDEDENVIQQQKQAVSTSDIKQQSQEGNKDGDKQIQLSDSKTGSVGFYSDGVNTFTFDAEKERLTGPNPFELKNQDAKSNPFVPSSLSSSTPVFTTNTNDQKFNTFTIPPSLNSSKNVQSTDVFKVAESGKKEQATTKNDESFNPFGKPPPKPQPQEQTDPFAPPTPTTTSATDKPKEEAPNNSSFSPFGPPPSKPKPQEQPDPFAPPPPTTTTSATDKPKEEPASTSSFSPFGPPPPKPKPQEQPDPFAPPPTTTAVTDKPKEEVPNNSSFSPFGPPPPKPKPQEQPDPFATPASSSATDKPKEEVTNNSSFSPFGPPPPKPQPQEQTDPFAPPPSSENQATDDVPFNPFGQVFPSKESDTSTNESSFTFKLRSNQTPDIDESDFLPVGQQESQPKSDTQPPKETQQQQEQQQPFSPFGFGAFNATTTTTQQQADSINKNQQQNNEENKTVKSPTQQPTPTTTRRDSSSSQGVSFVKRSGNYSPSDPFSLLIASLSPFTEKNPSEEASDEDEDDSNPQQNHHHHNHEEATDDDENENPFTKWNPTELDSALGKCEEPAELDSDTLNKFRGKVPPPPPFVAFEQSPAAKMLRDYCSQLSETGTSLEHINELLGLQDMARICIEEFSA